MQSRFTSKAQEALNYAADTAAMLGHGYIGSEHLLIGHIAGHYYFINQLGIFRQLNA